MLIEFTRASDGEPVLVNTEHVTMVMPVRTKLVSGMSDATQICMCEGGIIVRQTYAVVKADLGR